MNEHIGELRITAWEKVNKLNLDSRERDTYFTNIFAELIVKECLAVIKNKTTIESNEDYREGFHRARQFISRDIKEKFKDPNRSSK